MRLLILSLLLAVPLAGQSTAREKPFIADLRAKAMHGNAKAQFDLGVSYRFGLGVPPSNTEAAKWYRKAAAQGYPKAQFNLGVCYDFGRGVPKEPEIAVTWYRRAAEQGYAKAQYNLGVSYKFGQGVARDDAEAYAWLSLSAANGVTIALKSRNDLASRLSPEDLERARARARKLRQEVPPRKVR